MKQGVYEILNSKTNKRYIGSSIDIERRWKDHIRDLNNNKHHSIKLQRSWNKTKDKDIFKFNIIEIVDDINTLHKREQYYIDTYDSFYNGYNCSMVDDISINNKKITKKQKEEINKIRNKIYFENYMELYQEYKNSIDISKSYLRKMNNNYYSWIQYHKVVKLILEYEKYFSTKDYYIRLWKNNYEIWSYSHEPIIIYSYIIKNDNLYIDNIYENTYTLNPDSEKYKKYLYR